MPEHFTITGRVTGDKDQPVSGYTVQAFDRDPGIYMRPDDRLGKSKTDENGSFRIIFTDDAFRDLFEGKPEIYLVVRDKEGRMIRTVEHKGKFTKSMDFSIKLSGSGRSEHEGGQCSIKQPMYCSSGRLDDMFEISDNVFSKETLINSGNLEIVEGDNWSFDTGALTIWNNRYWKGFLSTDRDIFNKILVYGAGFYKRFWKEGSSVKGETHPYDSLIYAANESIETEFPGFGRVLYLKYRDPPNNMSYDLMKIVDKDTIIGKAFTGREPPEGNPLLNFSLSRKYGIDFMTHDDFKIIFSKKASKPDVNDVPGSWEGRLISDSIHSPVLFRFRYYEEKGSLKCKLIFGGIIPGTPEIKFTEEMMEMFDFAGQLFHDEIRMLNKDVMLGKYCTKASPVFNLFKRAPGFLMKDDNRICLPYILRRIS